VPNKTSPTQSRSLAGPTRLALLTALVVAAPAMAAPLPDPKISDAEANFARPAAAITIHGTGFGALAPRVEIGSVVAPLTVTSHSPIKVVADLPQGIAPGSYYLTLTTQRMDKNHVAVGETDAYWVTLEGGAPPVWVSQEN
jgi:hypothetical protein